MDDKLSRLQYRAKTDHIWLANEILGYDFQENPHAGLFACYLQKSPEKTLFDLDPQKKSRLILWPRGHYKTTGSAVEMVQLILNYPDIRIGILSGDKKEARKRLKEVKDHFIDWGKDGKLQKLFPEFCSKEQGVRLGTQDAFTSPARKRKSLREPTLCVASPKMIKAGGHLDVIFVDDLVNEINSKNKEQLQKAIDDYKTFVPLLDPGGYAIVTGTRYSFDDAYGWIQEQIKKQGLSHWLVSIRTCWITRCKKCDHADIRHYDGGGACGVEACDCSKFESNGIPEVLFPQTQAEDGRTIGFTVETLQAIKAEEGEEFFACQYENNPLAGTERMFSEEFLAAHVLQPSQIPQRGATFLMIDLAYSMNERADDLVIYVFRIKQGRLFLIDCVSGRIDPEIQPQTVAVLCSKYAPRKVFIEKKTGAQYFEKMLMMYIAQHPQVARYIPVELIKADNAKGAKDRRIASIRAVIAEGRLWFSAGLPNWETLVTQLVRFPKSQRHDDHADCLGLGVQCPTGFELDPLPSSEIPFWLKEPKLPKVVIDNNGLPYGLNG